MLSGRGVATLGGQNPISVTYGTLTYTEGANDVYVHGKENPCVMRYRLANDLITVPDTLSNLLYADQHGNQVERWCTCHQSCI